MSNLIGFHDDQELKAITGITRGTLVIIPKGTSVKSTHPSKKEYVTKKDMKVKVHHFMNGMNLPLNDKYSQAEVADYLEISGAFCLLGTTINGEILPRGINASVPVKNPSVTWIGSGGYWCEADINQIVVINN